MTFVKSTLFLPLFTILTHLAVAAPPACLLAAVNSESNPADVLTLCGKDSSKVQAQIKKLCGDNVEAALYAYNTTCQEHGKLISTESSSPHGKHTSSSRSGSSPVSASVSRTLPTGSVTSAPYPVTYTSTYYDSLCSCTKTGYISSSGIFSSSGSISAAWGATLTGFPYPSGSAVSSLGSNFGSGLSSGPGSSAIGSPIIPSGTKAPGSTSTSPLFAGDASRNLGPLSAIALAVGCIALAL